MGASGPVIEVEALTKVFRRKVMAVTDLSFSVRPGRVTGFLGPNGSGKTTTLRCILGLVRPTSGCTSIDGLPYDQLPQPARTIGAALEATGFYPGRTGREHLRVLAAAEGISDRRVDEILEGTGLTQASGRRVAEYSLGMRQRLGLAAALLADPGALVLDEPANGLDPEGIAWLRGFLRHRADAGGTVLVSSHVLAEVQQTVDDVVIVRQGTLMHAGPLAELADRSRRVIVRSPEPALLERVVLAQGWDFRKQADGSLAIDGQGLATVGAACHAAGCELHELSAASDDLERVFLELMGEEKR